MNIYRRDGSLITDQYDTVSAAVAAGVNLTHAYLTDANLTGANLTGAVLTHAYLTHAYLTDADLTGAVLTGAVISLGNRIIALGKDQ
jgi:uncharacterized protein YjbI with pentapeptide repeats